MEALWIAVFAIFLLGYFALEGMIIGAGMLLPIIARGRDQRAQLISLMGRFFLASEVWLVAVIGVLFGVFPTLEGKILAGLYPVVIAFLISWIIRSAGLWLRGRIDAKVWRAVWELAIVAGSWAMAALWGVALATIASGIPAETPGGLIDPRAAYAHPLAVLGAIVMVGLFALHGAAFAKSRLRPRPAVPAGLKLWRTGLAMIAPTAILLIFALPALSAAIVPQQTLSALTMIAGPFLPLLALGQIWAWRVTWKSPADAAAYL